jgi:hypothetical protein
VEIIMQNDDGDYHASQAYVYAGDLALLEGDIWAGIDVLEQRGASLDSIAYALTKDWETSVRTLGMLGRRRA